MPIWCNDLNLVELLADSSAMVELEVMARVWVGVFMIVVILLLVVLAVVVVVAIVLVLAALVVQLLR